MMLKTIIIKNIMQELPSHLDDGFLVYTLCDPSNGYVWSSFFQFDNTVQLEPDLSKTFSAVHHLTAQLQATGHHVYVDNLYSSAKLAEKLLTLDHLYTCTARADRIPSCVRQDVLEGDAAAQARGSSGHHGMGSSLRRTTTASRWRC